MQRNVGAHTGGQGAVSLASGLGDPKSASRRTYSRVARRQKLAAAVCVFPLFNKHRFPVLGEGAPVFELIENVSKLGA